MSSWDRSRQIPWSKIQEGGDLSPEKHRERVWKELRQEALLEEQEQKQHLETSKGTTDTQFDTSPNTTITTPNPIKRTVKLNMFGLQGQPFATGDCFKQALFGATLGSITGATFGFMDGMRQAGESSVLKKASSSAKGRFLFQGTSRSGMMFGAFFGGFHTLRYGIRVIGDPGDYTEISIAGVTSLGIMFARPTTRASLPYASMLVIMDAFNTYMNETE